jgi:nicotinamidase-related amidase
MGQRVWERFLTDADKEHLAATPRRPVGLGQRPALLLVDLYRAAFGDHERSFTEPTDEWPQGCGEAAWRALPPIQQLLAAARVSGIPVVHVTMDHDSGAPGWFEATHRSVDGSPPARPLTWRGEQTEIIPELAPVDGEFVVRKSSPSAFWGTALSGHLRYLGVDTIFVGGESTSGCVRASVVDGCAHRYRMQVVEECVFDRHEAPHAISLFDMHQKYADVIALEDALAELTSLDDARSQGVR